MNLTTFILAILCWAASCSGEPGHHAVGHHGNHGNHGGHHCGRGRLGGRVGGGGNNGHGASHHHGHGHVAARGRRDRAHPAHGGGGKESVHRAANHLQENRRQSQKSAAHAKKKGHVSVTARPQTTRQREGSVKRSDKIRPFGTYRALLS